MASSASISLLEAEPDIGRFLTREECAAAGAAFLPLRAVRRGGLQLDELLTGTNCFGALIVDGMLLHSLQVADQSALQLVGPGDFLSRRTWAQSLLVSNYASSATTKTRLALLGDELLLAARRWPRILTCLHLRMSEQSERLTTQLAICQLPRVDQRLLAIMWLLAESWGQVTQSGTTLPLMLTHDLLGGLIGARRPTVTLALGALADRGALVRQDRGWLLLEPPPRPSQPPPQIDTSELMPTWESSWISAGQEVSDRLDTHTELAAQLRRLHEEHSANVERVRDRLERLARTREECARARQNVARQALSRRPAPS